MTAPRVTVLGGGLAGLTAALRLADRGHQVTLYEAQGSFGGNLGAHRAPDGTYHDVYPHMYLPWYHNFFTIAQDVTGRDHRDNFEPITGVRRLARGEFPRFRALTETFRPGTMIENLFSGVLPPADMFVFAYANWDLLAERLQPTAIADQLSVNGFIHSRPYMTRAAAEAFEWWIDLVWSVPSDDTSAIAYQQYLAHSVTRPTPALWLLAGSTAANLIEPWVDTLSERGVELSPNVAATAIVVDGGRVSGVELAFGGVSPDGPRIDPVENLVVAVPPTVANRLVRSGPAGRRVVDHAPQLTELGRLRTTDIPVLHLYFRRKLANIPREPVSMDGARFGLAFTDISLNWPGEYFVDHTVMAVSSSSPVELPGPDDRGNAVALIRELARFIDFEMGASWGDSDDIDWDRTEYSSNDQQQIFINEVGSDLWRPPSACDEIDNLFFAGDYCQSDIGMATVEAAVVSGLEAASAVVESTGGEPVEIIEPGQWPAAFFVAARWAWAPWVAAAKVWSELTTVDARDRDAGDRDGDRAGDDRRSSWSARMRRVFTPS